MIGNVQVMVSLVSLAQATKQILIRHSHLGAFPSTVTVTLKRSAHRIDPSGLSHHLLLLPHFS